MFGSSPYRPWAGLFILAFAGLVTAWACGAAAMFPAPGGSGWAMWEAENAKTVGEWRLTADPSASGGRYMEVGRSGSALQFSFVVDRPTTLKIKPIWWRSSERRAARTFPYPLERLPGPDAVDQAAGLVWFTAPTAGRIGIVDPDSEKLLGYVEVGGYLSDLVVDPASQLLYVADASGNRVVVVDPATRAVIARVAVPEEPWSLALSEGRLYVACRAARCMVAVDCARGEVVRRISLPAAPIGVEVAKTGGLVLRFQQQPVHVETAEALECDQLQYPVEGPRRSAKLGADKTYDSPQPDVLRVKTKTESKLIDVKAATGAPSPGSAPTAASGEPGPRAMVIFGQWLYFTSPAAGTIGVVDTKTDALVKTISVGGCPVDIVAAPAAKRLYVADRAGSRVVGLDADRQEVAGEFRLEACPCSLEWVGSYEIQRPGLVPPTAVNRLFIACREPNTLLALDVSAGRVVRQLPLPAPPRLVRFVPMPASGWWPLLADDRIAFALTPRLAVEYEPASVDAAGQVTAAPADVGVSAPRRRSVRVKLPATEKTFEVNNELLVRVDGKRELDVSTLADPQLVPMQPLTGSYTTGSITYSLDGGPAWDWTRNIRMRPDNNMLLVTDSDEYWEWNAPRLTIRPGRHVLEVRAHGPCVGLDALAVARTPEQLVNMELIPEPQELHSQVPSSYQGVFYDTEAPKFMLRLQNRGPRDVQFRVTTTLENYLGQQVAERNTVEESMSPGAVIERHLHYSLPDSGRFHLIATLQCEDGEMTRDAHFVRLPKLEHPRLFFRKADLPRIQERIAQHPRLFRRWVEWLVRQSQKEGNWPERFLPNGLTAGELGQAAPPGTTGPTMVYGWRMYELGWRMLACQFAARFVPPLGDKPHAEILEARLEPLLAAKSTDMYCQYHYHGPFFPGAVEGLLDMAPDDLRKELPLTGFLAARKGNMDVAPFTLVSLEEPLTPKDRAVVYEIATLQNNFQRYFQTHAGIRGGTLWQNPWTGCFCPTQGMLMSLLLTSNFLGEEHLFDLPFIRGFFTFHRYADPIRDVRNLLPAHRGPLGEPWRWLFTSIARHPLEKSEYRWDEWIAKLDGDLPQPEEQAVDDLFALKGMPLTGRLVGGAHHFVTGAVVPMALALGWYDPAAPEVKRQELPPTTLFDVEGWAAMRSGWDDKATEVAFISGARDHTCRHQANHFTIVKSGEFLIGTPALWGDDGNCTPAWGNTVVAGSNWVRRWQLNLSHPRAEETAIIDRFSPATWTYIARDRRLCGYAPAESGWGGGLDMHGHTETLFTQQGRIIAYETRPAFDYVAGDASLAWPCEELRSHWRQLVFLKPDVVVIYDRVALGPHGNESRWLACTGPGLQVDASGFSVEAEAAALRGQVLLPRQAVISEANLIPYFQWKGQQLLEITPREQADEMEYLVVMTVGEGNLSPTTVALVDTPASVGVQLRHRGKPMEVRFNRRGPVGGQILGLRDSPQAAENLAQGIQDSYARWEGDPRFKQWVTERRFDFVIPEVDRR